MHTRSHYTHTHIHYAHTIRLHHTSTHIKQHTHAHTHIHLCSETGSGDSRSPRRGGNGREDTDDTGSMSGEGSDLIDDDDEDGSRASSGGTSIAQRIILHME